LHILMDQAIYSPPFSRLDWPHHDLEVLGLSIWIQR
jgi:hypothetical protein